MKFWLQQHYKTLLISLASMLLVGFGIFYIFLPPLNVHSTSFWVFLTAVLAALLLPWLIAFGKERAGRKAFQVYTNGGKVSFHFSPNKKSLILVAVIVVPLVVMIVGNLFSSKIFFAKKYANIIEVKDGVFSEDLPEANEITHIALMDTESARRLGDRTLGALSDVVSQYDVSPIYTQINYGGKPQKVSNLEYDDFFKWLSNRKNGIPGLVMVDPVNSTAEYLALKEPMRYAKSAFFHEDLLRKLRFSYPTKIFQSVSFEIDETGNPFYIVSCAKPRVSMFGAKDVHEVIIFNPCDGSSEIFKTADVPTWVDIVYDGDLASVKYNWQGRLSGGFLNSIIGNVGCKQTTDDFGYITLDDDVWYFTGVTSVTADKSNIGFILSNARTGEYKFYSVIGAEEHSAMAAAEGEVQEKGYVASFPSLVNVSGQPTYIMVLKDAAGLVKLYALVNVQNYSIVATGSTQAEAMSEYKKLLKQSDIDIGTTDEAITVTVENVRIATVGGVSTVYITATTGKVYKGYLEADESLILVRKGDTLNISYIAGNTEGVFVISNWSFAS